MVFDHNNINYFFLDSAIIIINIDKHKYIFKRLFCNFSWNSGSIKILEKFNAITRKYLVLTDSMFLLRFSISASKRHPPISSEEEKKASQDF
jgi:hypothetical protein